MHLELGHMVNKHLVVDMRLVGLDLVDKHLELDLVDKHLELDLVDKHLVGLD
jgi:hypothetical protein